MSISFSPTNHVWGSNYQGWEMGIGFGTLPRSREDRKSTRLNSGHRCISYAVFCLKKKKLNSTLTHGNASLTLTYNCPGYTDASCSRASIILNIRARPSSVTSNYTHK